MPVEWLKHRQDFKKVSYQRSRHVASDFILQKRNRKDDDAAIRVGLIATKKIGNAVARNRAKRRLRALVREIFEGRALAGHDYVLVARHTVVTVNFESLKTQMVNGLQDNA